MEAILDAMIGLLRTQIQGIDGRLEALQDQMRLQEHLAKISEKRHGTYQKSERMMAIEKEMDALRSQRKQLEEKIRKYASSRPKTTSTSSTRVQEALQTLGLPVNCTDAEKIKDAYRKLAKQHHPDAGGDALAMAKINEAYQIVSEYAK